MNIFQKWSAKRAAKKAAKQYEVELAAWEREGKVFEKLQRAFEAARDGVSIIDENMVNKKGEISLWKSQAQYHEAARGKGEYVGRSDGFSVRIAKGVSYRAGAQRGTYVQGELEQKYEDVGMAHLTTDRLIFIGPGNTAEWAFSKWIGASALENPDDFIFNVSNRKRSSGLLFPKGVGSEFSKFLALAIGYNESGVEQVLKSIEHYKKEHEEKKPKAPVLEATSVRVEKPALPSGESDAEK